MKIRIKIIWACHRPSQVQLAPVAEEFVAGLPKEIDVPDGESADVACRKHF